MGQGIDGMERYRQEDRCYRWDGVDRMGLVGEEVEPEFDAGEEFAGEVFGTSGEGGRQVGVVGYGVDVVVVGE